jgi:hypothetical protein
MSQRPISLSQDLTMLRNEGYDISVVAGHLVMKDVPYVTPAKTIQRGTLVSNLELANDVTVKPNNHVAHFIGEHPCNSDGTTITKIQNPSAPQNLAKDLRVDYTFSAKPPNGYDDYYHKMTNYVAIISGQAQAIDSTVTAKTFALATAAEEDSVFKYVDTASSRAGISAISQKLEIGKIAIIGMGGTASYILDLVAKTPVKEIHLFDGDRFLQHNAFRSPGAASGEDLSAKLFKVRYFEKQYSNMRRGIVPHEFNIDSSNVELLKEMNFVFICIDKNKVKGPIIQKLEELGIPFIDVGLGVLAVDNAVSGIIQVTTSTTAKRDHVHAKKRISFVDGEGHDNDYNHNIQIADLNALNAALAVIKWKKIFGFYHDFDREHYCTYTIDGNKLMNEDKT